MQKTFKFACALCVLRAMFGFSGQINAIGEGSPATESPEQISDRLAVDEVFDFSQSSEGLEIAPLRRDLRG